MFKTLRDEIAAMMARDPAARSALEVALCYPGFHAIMLHRLAHRAWRRDWQLAARAIAQIGRFLTGIEIHPGARIAKDFFIHHGMGVEVGETAVTGDGASLYHVVTLRGVPPWAVSESARTRTRHPNIGSTLGWGIRWRELS